MTRIAVSALILLTLGGCWEDEAALPDPVALTEDNVSHFCQMNVLAHGGPKAQVHLEGYPAPLFFAQVRDAVIYLKSPERDARILTSYVSNMGAAKSWSQPGTTNWVASDSAVFVIEAGVAGGMGAPEVVPFANRDDALTFTDRYGGQIVALADIPDETVLSPVDPNRTLQVPQ